MVNIETITSQSFAPFGTVLEFSENAPDPRFEVKVCEAQANWRIAVFCVRCKTAARLECHPQSLESFTPIAGTGILLCAAPQTPQEYHAFLLDKGVCLNKGVWHEVLTLSDTAYFEITENLQVESVFYDFAKPVCAAVTEN